MLIKTLYCAALIFCLLLSSFSQADNLPELRVGVLKYGTLNWELDLAELQHLPDQYGFKLVRVPLGSPQALSVALQGDAVDIIVGDWLWAARQTDEGRAYSFYPYSTAAGELVVPANTKATSIADLKGKTIGFAGGKGNKNWILYSAYANQHFGIDLEQNTRVKFAAPPMLNQLLLRGQMDAVVNFWHYAAELKTESMKSLLTMQEVLKSWDITGEVPVLGWLFKQPWANEHRALVNQFFAMSYSVRQQMKKDDSVWQSIPSFTQKYSAQAQPVLVEHYRQGIPTRFDKSVKHNLQQLFKVIKNNQGSSNVTGNLNSLPASLFWAGGVLTDQ